MYSNSNNNSDSNLAASSHYRQSSNQFNATIPKIAEIPRMICSSPVPGGGGGSGTVLPFLVISPIEEG